VMSGPLVRSSYRAGRLHAEAMARRAPAGTGPAGPIGTIGTAAAADSAPAAG
jgi:hypothetical protein